MFKKIIIGLFVVLSWFYASNVLAADYNPPFELSGIVMTVSEDSIEVHLPYINKQVLVKVAPHTIISNRLKEKNIVCKISEITAQDLVVIKGVVQKEIFLSTEISFVPN
ncbi:MAG: hypothetical protein KJ915_08240 [Candidatus Omnitrophica bacterium]|nr:hypothetical protein [Candidatus Omnitrophota bacterium]